MSEDVSLSLARPLHLPQDPELLVRLNAAVQISGGVLLLTRLHRPAALMLIASMLPTTYAGHRFWATDDPQEFSRQLTQFCKNVGLVGGLLLDLASRT